MVYMVSPAIILFKPAPLSYLSIKTKEGRTLGDRPVSI